MDQAVGDKSVNEDESVPSSNTNGDYPDTALLVSSVDHHSVDDTTDDGRRATQGESSAAGTAESEKEEVEEGSSSGGGGGGGGCDEAVVPLTPNDDEEEIMPDTSDVEAPCCITAHGNSSSNIDSNEGFREDQSQHDEVTDGDSPNIARANPREEEEEERKEEHGASAKAIEEDEDEEAEEDISKRNDGSAAAAAAAAVNDTTCSTLPHKEAEEEGEEEAKSDMDFHLIGAVHVQQDLETGRIQMTPVSVTRQPRLTTVVVDEVDVDEIDVDELDRGEGEGIDATPQNIPADSRPSTETIATANRIEENCLDDLQVAQEFVRGDDQNQSKTQRHTTLIYFGLGLILVVGFLILVFLLMATSSGSSSSNGGTTIQNSDNGNDDKVLSEGEMGIGDLSEYVLSVLPAYSVSKIDLNDQRISSSTPQTKAFQWILKDPWLTRYPDWRIVQRFALSTFYYATDGEHWLKSTDWLSYRVPEIYWHAEVHRTTDEFFGDFFTSFGIDAQNWLDVLLDNGGDEVTYLLLASNNLKGEVPEEIYLLSSLRIIDLHKNKQLGGTLSTRIGNFRNLEIFSISSNEFTGTIPTEVGLLPSILSAMLLGNFLTGTIPTEIGEMPIWFLGLDSNQLTGSIPSEFGSVPRLLSLSLFDNLLTSTIPSELGQLDSLNSLGLFGNPISGTIPTQIFAAFGKPDMNFYVETMKQMYPNLAILAKGLPLAALLEPQMTSAILLQRTQLLGPIPTQVGLVHTLSMFFAHYNKLTGHIPTQLGDHPDLESLALHGNFLSGTVPTELASLPVLEFLTLSENLLTGSIPHELVKLSALNILWMADNALSSTIPRGFDDFFTKKVPPCCGMETIPLVGAELDLSRNLLSGPFPTSVGRKLVRLAVESNQLTGTIAGDLGDNGWLEYLDAGHNLITGTLSSEIASWPALKSFNVTSNLLTGLVPSEIRMLNNQSFSTMFDLRDNTFGAST